VNRESLAGALAGAPVGYLPALISSGAHTGSLGLAGLLLLALLPAAMIGAALGVTIALASNYPRLGSFMIGGAAGVLSGIVASF
jgi:hypothetical protein